MFYGERLDIYFSPKTHFGLVKYFKSSILQKNDTPRRPFFAREIQIYNI